MYQIQLCHSAYDNGSSYIPTGYEGNVDLLMRPRVTGTDMIVAGWTEADAADYATVYTNTFSIGDTSRGFDFPSAINAIINITPIMQNGTVFSPAQLESYLESLAASAVSKANLLELDMNNRRLLLSVKEVAATANLAAEYEEAGNWAEALHELQDAWFTYKDGYTITYTTIYDQSRMNELSTIEPKCSLEINEAGNLTFTLLPGHPLINTLEPLSSFVRALDDGEEIFYGRILQRSKPTLRGMVSFQCEGALSFLLDSEIAPYGKDSRGTQITRRLSAETFFRECIDQHNAEVQDIRRQFTIGTINAAKRGTVDDYSINRFQQTKDAIESQILNVYGGFIRIRPGSNGSHIIDWIENYETLNPQEIAIGVNLEDQTNELDGSSLFTVLRPVGKDNLTLPEKTIDLYDPADIAKYGRIVKSIEFNGATTEADLRAQANEYRNRIQKTLFTTTHIQMVDMHYLDGTSPKIRIGNRFTNLHGLSGVEMVASSLELNFENPQNDSIDLKNRKSLDPDLTPEGNAHAGKNLSKSSKGSGGGQFFKYLKETGEMLEILAPQVYMHGQTLEQHYEQIRTTANSIVTLSRRAGDIENTLEPIQEKWNDVLYTIETVSGAGTIQNDQFISALAGKFEIWTDGQGNTTVHLKDGAELAVDDQNGGTITVGTRISQIAATVNGQQAVVDSFAGSALWTQRDQITGVCGEYDIQYVTVEEPPGSGNFVTKKTLVLKSGGGMKIRKDNVEYGIYMTDDGGNTVLTGGLMVTKINNETTTKILGSRVDINAGDVNISATKTLSNFVGHWEIQEYRDELGHLCSRLVYVGDGGMRVRRTVDDEVVAEFGLYDEGNLTGGVVVQKINGQTETHIKGSKVVIGDDLSDDDLAGWASDATGAIAARATIAQLNAVRARVTTLESVDLRAEIANINNLQVKGIYGANSSADCRFNEFYGNYYKVNVPGGAGSVTYNDLTDGVYDLQIVSPGSGSNTYTLQKRNAKSSTWVDVGTFSRATQLNGEWSGNVDPGQTLTVNASPQGNHYTIGFTGTVDQKIGVYSNGTPTLNASNPNMLDVPVKLCTITYVSSQDPNHQTTRYEGTVLASGVPAYNRGWDAARAATVMPGEYTGSGENLSFVVKTPNEARTGSDDRTFTIVKGDTPGPSGYASVMLITGTGNTQGGNNGVLVGRIDVGNWYSSGWSSARSQCDIPTSQNLSSDSVTFKKPKSTVNGGYDPVTYTLYVSNDYAQVRYGTTVICQTANTGYGNGQTNGWTLAREACDIPTAQNLSAASVTLKKPKSTFNGGSDTYTYSLYVSNDYAQLRYGTTVICQTANTGYGAGETSGWSAAYGKVVVPGSNNTSASATFKTPASASTSDPVQNSHVLTIESSGNNSVILKRVTNSGSAVTIAALTHNKYNAGFDAVTISDPAWTNTTTPYTGNSNTVTVSASTKTDGTTKREKAITLTLTENASAKTVTMKHNNVVRATVSTANTYGAGWSAARNASDIPTGQNLSATSVTVKKPKSTVDGGSDSYTYALAVTNDYAQLKYGTTVICQTANTGYAAGQKNTRDSVNAALVTLSGNVVYDSGTSKYMQSGTATVQFSNGQTQITNINCAGGVDVTTAYNSGKGDGKNAVTLLDPTWNSISGNPTASRTVTVKTSGRGSELEKSVALFLTQDENFNSSNVKTVYMRTVSTTGTIYAQTTVDASGVYTAGKKNTRDSVQKVPVVLNGNVVYDSSTHKYMQNGKADVYFSNGQTTVTGVDCYGGVDVSGAYGSGWNAARNQCSIPTGQNLSGSSINLSAPSATVGGSAVPYTFSLAISGDYAQLKYGTTVLCQTPLPASQAVTISSAYVTLTGSPVPNDAGGYSMAGTVSVNYSDGTSASHNCDGGVDVTTAYNAGASSNPSYSHSASLTRYRAGAVESIIPGILYRRESNGTYTALGTSSTYWYGTSTNMGSGVTVHY